MEKNMSKKAAVESTPQQPPAAEGPNLNIADLVNVLQVINTCSSRGVFQAAELSSVGGLYDRLHAFLLASGALPQPDGSKPTKPEAST
jgi:hypothetical protein